MAATASPTTLLRPDILMSLANLDLVARAAIEGFMVGMHRSPSFGFSQEFAEYRAYQPGDDLRFVDWNVYARTGRTYLKRFLGETSTHLTLMLDTSASMGFSTGKATKLDTGKFLAAALAYLAKRQHDALGLLIFDTQVRDFRPPRTSADAFPAVLHMLEKARPQAATSYSNPVAHYCKSLRKNGILAIISDFLDQPERMLDELRPLRGLGQDVILFQVLDPGEIKLDIDKPVRMEDVESGVQVNINPGQQTDDYSQSMSAHIQSVREIAHRTGADHVLVDTSQPLDDALRNYLLHRQMRR
jgi:uncharacterized protein (DUF58 family)